MAKTSIKQKDEFIKLREEGKTFQEIANMYGVSRQCIHQIVNREKVKKQRQTEKYKEMRNKYYAEHKKMFLNSQKKWRQKHPNYHRAYYATHKEQCREYVRRYKQRKKAEKISA